MSFNPNNFIAYSDEVNNNFSEIDFSTSGSPFRSSDDHDTKSETPFGLSTHSSANNYSTPYNADFDFDAFINPPKWKPFTIIRTTFKERQEQIKLSNKSKKIQKRYIAKERTQAKQEVAALLEKAPQKYIPPGIDDPDLDDKTKRRLVQKLKNRIASQHTRDSRKQRMSELEEVKMLLEKANKELNERNRMLNERNMALEETLRTVQDEKLQLQRENNELRRRDIPPEPLPNFDNKSAVHQSIDFTLDENFDEIDEEKLMLSPTLHRKQTKSDNHYFTFLLGILTICVVCSGIAVKIGQGTKHKPPVSPSTEEPTFGGVPNNANEGAFDDGNERDFDIGGSRGKESISDDYGTPKGIPSGNGTPQPTHTSEPSEPSPPSQSQPSPGLYSGSADSLRKCPPFILFVCIIIFFLISI